LEFQKRVNNWGIESLKLADIYYRINNGIEWNEEECRKHHKDMTNILNSYHKYD